MQVKHWYTNERWSSTEEDEKPVEETYLFVIWQDVKMQANYMLIINVDLPPTLFGLWEKPTSSITRLTTSQ